jgi:hypothetical protein
MKRNFTEIIDQIKQIEKTQFELSSSITNLKQSIVDLDMITNPNGLLLISNLIANVDSLINCVRPNVQVFKYDIKWDYKTFNLHLEKILCRFEPNQLKLVGWVFDNNGSKMQMCSDYVIDLEKTYDIKQYQQLIDIINLVSEYVDKSKTNRFDLISCDLSSEPYAHMIKLLELVTHLKYAYSNDLTGNVANSDWILEEGNETTIDLLSTYFDKSRINDLKVDIKLGASDLVNKTFLLAKGFNDIQTSFIINAGFIQSEITNLLTKYNQAQITNFISSLKLNKNQIITLSNANFTYTNTSNLLSNGFTYANITDLLSIGFNSDQIITLSNTKFSYYQLRSMLTTIISNTNYSYVNITDLLSKEFKFGNIIKMAKKNLTPTQINAILSKGYIPTTLMLIVNMSFNSDQIYSLAYTNNYSYDQIYNLVSADYTYDQILIFSSTQLRDLISKGFTYDQVLKMILGNYSYANILDLLNTKSFTTQEVLNIVAANYSYDQICDLLDNKNFRSSQMAKMAVAKFSYNQLIKLYNKGFVSTTLVLLISQFTYDQIITIADANWKPSQITTLLFQNFTKDQIMSIINAKLTFDQVNTLLSATYGITQNQLLAYASNNYSYDQIDKLLKTRSFNNNQLVSLANNDYSYANIVDLLDKRSFTKDNINNLAAKNVTYSQIIDLIDKKKFTKDQIINLLIEKVFTFGQVVLLFKANLSYTQITDYLSTHTNDQTINYAQNTIIVNNKYTTAEINTLLSTYNFNYDQIILMANSNLSYVQITDLIANGFKPLYLITSNITSPQLKYITNNTLTEGQVVGLLKAGLTKSMFNTNTSEVSEFKSVGFNNASVVTLLNLGYSYSVIINLIAQSEISFGNFYNGSTGLHDKLIARGFKVEKIDDFLRYLSISKLRDLTNIDWFIPDANSTSTIYQHVIFKPNPNTDITGIDMYNFYSNIANSIANKLTPGDFTTEFPQSCDFDQYVKNNPGKSRNELEDYLINHSIDAGLDVYLVSYYTDVSSAKKEPLLFISKLTMEGVRAGFQEFANGLTSQLANRYSTVFELKKLDFSSPEFAAALGNALKNSPYFKSASTDQIGNFLKSVGAKINSYANKEISVLESNVTKYVSVVETETKQFTTDLINTVANSDELKKLKSGITLVSKDMTKFATKFGDEFKDAMINTNWEEVGAYIEEVSAYIAAFDPTGLGGLAFAVKDLTESSIAFKADKSNDNLFALVFAVINCVLALIGVLMFVAGGAASIAKKMVFQVLDRLVVPLLSAYGAIVPALITYINDPKGGEAPQTNQQALIDACIQSGIGIAMAQA